VLQYGIGLTNLCDRTSREANELTKDEMAAGAANLRAKLELFRPRVVCFNGMGIYEAFVPQLRPNGAPRREKVTPGLQPETLGDALMYVVPSSSGRTAAYPRQAKLAFYEKLRDLLQSLPETVTA
jgi:TDG/mug DNA glycosylase family protein